MDVLSLIKKLIEKYIKSPSVSSTCSSTSVSKIISTSVSTHTISSDWVNDGTNYIKVNNITTSSPESGYISCPSVVATSSPNILHGIGMISTNMISNRYSSSFQVLDNSNKPVLRLTQDGEIVVTGNPNKVARRFLRSISYHIQYESLDSIVRRQMFVGYPEI